MTQAFNLAQLANNLNTSGQLDATDGLNGLIANANLASSGSASSSTYLRGDRIWASLPAFGKLLQIQTTLKTDAFVSSATGWNDLPGVSVTITPSATSSRILVISNVTGGGQTNVTHMQLKLVRNSTDIAIGDQGTGSTVRATTHVPVFSSGDNVNNHPMIVLDSPSTTSATTYKVQFRNNNSNGNIYVNQTQSQGTLNTSTTVSQITVLEIGA